MKQLQWGLVAGLAMWSFHVGLSAERAELTTLVAVTVLLVLASVTMKRMEPRSRFALLAAALAIRMLALFHFSTPQLSEDWVRYAWDGWVLNHGHWPTSVVPDEWEERPPVAWTEDLAWMHSRMNSRQYAGVYPPVAQFVFALPWRIGVASPRAWWKAYQAMLVLVDMMTICCLMVLLERFGKPWHWAGLYAFHPLVLLEGIGNGHLELLVIGAGAAGAWCWTGNVRTHRCADLFGWVAVGLKWLPILALPAWAWARWEHKRKEGWGWVLLSLAAVACAAMAWSSMRLFANRFEFHAGPYYLLRNAWMAAGPFNPIHWLGPLCMAAGLGGVLWSAFRSEWNLAERWTAGWALWLACATTVHPWYAMYLIPLGLFTRWTWPIWVSAAGVLSYAHYAALPMVPWALMAHWGVAAVAVALDWGRRDLA